MRLVFAHGSGDVGRDAFPQQAASFPDAEFPVLPGYGDDAPAVGDVATAAQRLAMLAADADALVGYSYGGVTAAMAACLEHAPALVLIEPALFQLSRHRPATARLIERLEPLYLDTSQTDAAFGRALLLALRGEDPGEATSDEALRWSRRTRLHGAPWRHPIDAECIAETPALVVTGGWNEEYEEVAAALVELGAEHEVLPGHGHRVIDHPDCSGRIREFVAAACMIGAAPEARCYTDRVPTTRPRHSVTETDAIAHALDVAARAWPDLQDDRAALLRRLIERGAETVESAVEQAFADRLEAIRATAGAGTGLYRRNERQLLREEWPE